MRQAKCIDPLLNMMDVTTWWTDFSLTIQSVVVSNEKALVSQRELSQSKTTCVHWFKTVIPFPFILIVNTNTLIISCNIRFTPSQWGKWMVVGIHDLTPAIKLLSYFVFRTINHPNNACWVCSKVMVRKKLRKRDREWEMYARFVGQRAFTIATHAY